MPVEQLSYEQIGQRLGASPAAARALVRRLRLPRVLDNGGRELVTIDFAEVVHDKWSAPDQPPDEQPMIARLQEQIAVLETELARFQQRTADGQAALEQERERCNQLIAALTELTHVSLTAALSAATAEARPWWRRLFGAA